MEKENNVTIRKFKKNYNQFGESYYEEERTIYKSEIGHLDKNLIPKEMKILKREKYIWHGFNKNPNFDKNFPISEKIK